MKKILFLFCILFAVEFSAQETTAMSYSQVLEKAKTEQKKVLLFFSGSDWCAPCVKFKKHFIDTEEFKTFASNSLAVYNADFPRLKKNQLAKDIIATNEQLAEKYNAKGYFPMILLLNANGDILHKWEQLPTETVTEFIAKLQ